MIDIFSIDPDRLSDAENEKIESIRKELIDVGRKFDSGPSKEFFIAMSLIKIGSYKLHGLKFEDFKVYNDAEDRLAKDILGCDNND